MLEVITVVLTILHVLLCLFLILVVLLQPGRGGGVGGAFGGSSQTVFGSRGAGSFLGKLTAIFATSFMVNSIILTKLSSTGGELPTAAPDEQGTSTIIAPGANLSLSGGQADAGTAGDAVVVFKPSEAATTDAGAPSTLDAGATKVLEPPPADAGPAPEAPAVPAEAPVAPATDAAATTPPPARARWCASSTAAA